MPAMYSCSAPPLFQVSVSKKRVSPEATSIRPTWISALASPAFG